MNPEQLHKIAVILLIAGILILIAAIFFSVRFDLISLLRTELNRKKDPKQTDGQDYFDSVKTKEIESIPADALAPAPDKTVPANRQQPVPDAQRTPATVLARSKTAAPGSQPARTGTVLAGAGKRQQERTGSGTLVVSARRRHPEPEPQEQKFVITDQILVMGGDPAAVSRCRTTTRKGSRNE